MNKMSQEKFQDRIMALQRARAIFSNLTEDNISKSFEAYQEILAEQEREVIISTITSGNRQSALFDQFERPKCPDCGADFMFRPLADNPEGYKVMLTCENPQCKTVLYSENDIQWWAEELRHGPEQTQKGE